MTRAGQAPERRAGFVDRDAAGEDWRDAAACRADRLAAAGLTFEVFFPESKRDASAARRARQLCACDCPVRVECLRYAVESRCTDGIFGALDPGERAAALRRAVRRGTDVVEAAVSSPEWRRGRDALGRFLPPAAVPDAAPEGSGPTEAPSGPTETPGGCERRGSGPRASTEPRGAFSAPPGSVSAAQDAPATPGTPDTPAMDRIGAAR